MAKAKEVVQEQRTINANGATYIISELPQETQELIAIFEVWNKDMILAKQEVFKFEAAIRAVSTEIEGRIANLQKPEDKA